ncbi:MAG: hypothetical protein FWE67_04815 [Planctomycetaceae bacterium]|nr:hypothetical protein [Planctomycetaceae bacterium]
MKSTFCFLLAALCCLGANVFSQSEFTDPLITPFADDEIQTVPLFNSCSYYFRPSDGAVFRTEYKRTDETGWHAAHNTVCDQPEKIHKGSIFNLAEDTEYQIRILTAQSNIGKLVAQTTFRTWNSTPRIAKTIDISTLPDTGKDGIIITEQGSPDAWIKYTAPADWIVRRALRDNDKLDAAIVLNGAKYIILENLTVEGGKRHGILVDNCDFVRILNCDISGWGRTGKQRFDNADRCGQYLDDAGKTINLDGGVQIRKSAATVVERCYIHDPRGRANSWVFSHPTGPEAVVVEYTRGGNVIRWNDFVGSDEHRWNDVIECVSNSSPIGGFYRDSDIIGNFLAFANDDGIELEGGGINLRFVGNKVEGVLCGISFGANMVGPQYAVGNLIVNLSDEGARRFAFLKNGHGETQKGKRFVYNNTFHGFGPSAASYGAYGSATPVDAGLGTMRNNIFVCNDSLTQSAWLRAENFDNDLFWVDRSSEASERLVAAFRHYGQEKNAITGDPRFIDPVIADFRLAPDSPARGKAVPVAGIIRAGDDLGAFFGGAADIPLRPLALATVPAEVNFRDIGGSDTVTLTLPANAEAPVEFKIRQNTVFDWFTVTPASGTIAPGGTMKLTVTAAPNKLTGRPAFRGAFLVRTQSGLSRPVSVYAKGVYTEEKHPASAGPNTVYIDGKGGMIDTSVNIPKDGGYSLLARIPRRKSPRFDISINGETSTAVVQSGYQWPAGTTEERVVWLHLLGQLKAGTNRIKVKYAGSDLTTVEYVITDNPAAFFIQERNARR